jgi:signal transduction histidine kinase
LTPLLVLLAVAAWTNEETVTTPDGNTVTETGSLSPWIPATVAVLVVLSAVASWWWAGREILLHERAAAAVDRERLLIEDASHQLRTPIAVLVTNADVALADADPTVDDLRAAVQQSRETATAMQSVVEGLLRQARTRRNEADRRTTDLVAIVADACRHHATSADEAGVALHRTGPQRLTAATDRAALERTIDALLDNAIRHSPPGAAVGLDIRDGGDEAVICIADAGPGIPTEDHAHIFARYWTTDPNRSGIGLAIAAEAGRDAFDIELESPTSADGGTKFVIRIPLHRP